MIRNEVEALKETGKPVVVFNVWSCRLWWLLDLNGADKILAQPTALTGSIGIFSVITTFEKGLNDLGVYTDGVGTSPFSGLGITTGLSDGAKTRSNGRENGYRRFISLVGENRDMEVAAVGKIARDSMDRSDTAEGLVDEIGDFDDAIKYHMLNKLQYAG